MIAGARPPRAPARTAGVFAALGDPTRLAIVNRLSDGSRRSIVQLSEGHPLTRQAITKHLRVLERARIVRHERAGRERLYVLDPAPIEDIRRYVGWVSSQWDARLARLKALVEE
ncbi:MAG: winged helix-turn-helix transcriptional regulator [Frateuria sp.]|uniref:ArsR/SmtB family transcription factor n=1 Tax=Frateuria sp. TaxID=2211372 RepID=UPI00183D1AF9|nr:metalloregulator ArsR/SmtB family transcription factor [Frateuria sp.]NUO71408.1 winged helix-turn-helix transcriptional regulator [Frateuria sp.]NUR22774.1 winged helix-turn-helix transcriptional regulator [Frateuria sp.]